MLTFIAVSALPLSLQIALRKLLRGEVIPQNCLAMDPSTQSSQILKRKVDRDTIISRGAVSGSSHDWLVPSRTFQGCQWISTLVSHRHVLELFDEEAFVDLSRSTAAVIDNPCSDNNACLNQSHSSFVFLDTLTASLYGSADLRPVE